jgi:hypothetical protein
MPAQEEKTKREIDTRGICSLPKPIEKRFFLKKFNSQIVSLTC